MTQPDPGFLTGRSILLVEDELLVALLVEDLLKEAGADILGPAPRVAAALQLIADADRIDLALLDVNLAGAWVWPVAEELRRRSVPYLLLTGYGAGIVDAEHMDAGVLTKPVSERDLLAAVAGVLSPGRS
ncbi:response regulator [Novispirillum sp. DQ9]|uniref:response regulator n=1 Tax=Novispirillum sp. DQ9 TaxID=3398612 RepID=UPI003C7997CD